MPEKPERRAEKPPSWKPPPRCANVPQEKTIRKVAVQMFWQDLDRSGFMALPSIETSTGF
jgi:hypothetical protein